MPFSYAIIPKLVKAEAVNQGQFQNVFRTLKKQRVSIKGHTADSSIPEIKFSYLVSLRNTKIRQLPRPQKTAYSITMS